MLSGSAFGSDGQRTLYFSEFDDPRRTTASRSAPTATNSTALRADDVGRLTLQGLYGSRDKAIPTASFGTVFNDPRSRTIEKQGFIDLQYDRALGAAWELGSRVYYDRYGYDGDYVFDLGTENEPRLVLNKDFARGNWWGAEVKASRKVAGRHRWRSARSSGTTSGRTSSTTTRSRSSSISTTAATRRTGRSTRRTRFQSTRSCCSTSACGTITTTRSAARPIRGSP